MNTFIPEGYTVWARQTLNSEIFFYKPDKWFKIWFYLVNRVNHKDNKLFKRGEGLISYNEIMKATKSSKRVVERCVTWLEAETMLVRVRTTRGRKSFIVNYDKFQVQNNYKVTDEVTDAVTLRGVEGESKGFPINKNEITKERKKRERGVFTPPTISAVEEYIAAEEYLVDAERFINFYQSNGWKVGKNKMKDWKAAIRGWESRDNPKGKNETKEQQITRLLENEIKIMLAACKKKYGNDGAEIARSRFHTKYGLDKAQEYKDLFN